MRKFWPEAIGIAIVGAFNIIVSGFWFAVLVGIITVATYAIVYTLCRKISK